MHGPLLRRCITIGVLLALAAASVALGWFLSAKGIGWAGSFGSFAAFVLGVIVLLGPLLRRGLRGRQPASTLAISDAADDLARVLSQQWVEDERLRRINDPHPFPVRWEVTRLAESAMPGVSIDASDDANSKGTRSLSGHFGEVLSMFLQLPSRRLVILGSAGAGKSVLATKLARELLAMRSPGGSVPVILPAISWDAVQSLSDWIVEQLTRNHPGLSATVKATTGKETSFAELLASSNVIPILDGLDELPEDVRGDFIKEINGWGSDIPIILTSRPQEYIAAVQDAGRAISRSVAVELLPLRIEEVEAYLNEATSAFPAERWCEVYECLEAEPDGPLAAVLTTPLMLWLARTIYETSDSDPAHLANRLRFKDQITIENHLLDAFVAAAYRKSTHWSWHSWTPGKVQRWLGKLAAYLDGPSRKVQFDVGPWSVAWWRLIGSVRFLRPLSAAVRAALFSAMAWGLAVWVLWRHGMWRHGAYAGQHSLGRLANFLLGGPLGREIQYSLGREIQYSLVAIPNYVSDLYIAFYHLMNTFQKASRNPSPHPPDTASVTASFKEHLQGLKEPLQVAVFGAFQWGSLLWIMLTASLIAAVLSMRTICRRRTWPKTTRVRLIPSVALVAYVFFVIMLVLPPNYTFVLGRAPGILFYLLLIAVLILPLQTRKFAADVDIFETVSPRKALQLDRKSTITVGLLKSAQRVTILWLLFGTDIALASSIFMVSRLLYEIMLGGTKSASGLYADARTLLVFSRRMPWSVMTFLIDAHRRGVFRQEGAVFQFRHARLQERLAAQYPKKHSTGRDTVDEKSHAIDLLK